MTHVACDSLCLSGDAAGQRGCTRRGGDTDAGKGPPQTSSPPRSAGHAAQLSAAQLLSPPPRQRPQSHLCSPPRCSLPNTHTHTCAHRSSSSAMVCVLDVGASLPAAHAEFRPRRFGRVTRAVRCAGVAAPEERVKKWGDVGRKESGSTLKSLTLSSPASVTPAFLRRRRLPALSAPPSPHHTTPHPLPHHVRRSGNRGHGVERRADRVYLRVPVWRRVPNHQGGCAARVRKRPFAVCGKLAALLGERGVRGRKAGLKAHAPSAGSSAACARVTEPLHQAVCATAPHIHSLSSAGARGRKQAGFGGTLTTRPPSPHRKNSLWAKTQRAARRAPCCCASSTTWVSGLCVGRGADACFASQKTHVEPTPFPSPLSRLCASRWLGPPPRRQGGCAGVVVKA